MDRLPDDWMAEWLQEREVVRLNPDGSNSVHRVQVVQCFRGDNEYYEETDLGDAGQYSGEPLTIWGASVTRVGGMKERADRERLARSLADRYGLEVPDMLGLLMQMTEEQWKVAHHVSVSGPAITRQR